MEIPKAYNSHDYEDKIYKSWIENDLFNPDSQKAKSKKNFSIVLPPPNVTGTLHLGHASMLAIEDLLIRYKKMQGFETVWIPGTDHASIATQNVVEKKLLQNGNKTRHELGREEFLKKVEEHVNESKSTIKNQVKKIGSALDWSREAYTLDEVRSKAVRKVFKNMFDDGLVYRGYRIVNWCPRCQSTLADDEVDYKETKSKLYWLKYGPFVLATTRPETKLGDTAVAVNPKDKRYQSMIGKKYMIPGVLGEFEIIVVEDNAVDINFGSGAIKVTPAHSAVDYEIALRHNLPIKKIIDENGRMMANCGKYFGMTTLEAREAIVADMQKMGLIDRIEENYENKLSVCYRCKTVIEPLPSNQWFVDVNKKITKKGNKYFKNGASLKEVALQVVRDGEIKIIPDRFAKTYEHWMSNLHDWCISRQIWFGHRIPVWYKDGFSAVFLRHGQAVGNANDALNSDITKIDNILTERGINQAKKSAEELKERKFDLIICSDFVRTKQTAKILAESLGISEIIEDPRLREIGVGNFEGKKNDEFIKFRQSNWPKWKNDNPENIESFDSWKKRIYSACENILQNYSDKKVLVVAHGDSIRMASSFNKDLTDEQIFKLPYPDNGKYFELTLQSTEIKVSETSISEKGWRQDEDTLDTWFSSGLWTFSTMLPKDWDGKDFSSSDIKRFHPISVMETGYDILFFWVARMILMTTYNIGQIPFENVFLHGLIRDKDGDKMSKSKPETAIDPLIAGEKYGMDAVRLSLLIGNTAGNDIRLYDEKIEGFRNLVNKLWNISRYIISNLQEKNILSQMQAGDWGKSKDWTMFDRAIISKWQKTKQKITAGMEEYNFSASGELLREFMWDDLADWYLEIAKVENKKENILYNILVEILKMWQPFIPFVTQAIYENLQPQKFLMTEFWPEANKKYLADEAESEYEKFRELVSTIRNLRVTYKIDPVKKIDLCFAKKTKFIAEILPALQSLARISAVSFVDSKPPQSAEAIVADLTVYLPLAQLLDLEEEKQKQQKELTALQNYISVLQKKLTNEEFVKNAPPAIVEGEKQKLREAQEKKQKLQEIIAGL
ncbi:MAG: class I tRNA ligase family protein [Patescibacteria group bacterium]